MVASYLGIISEGLSRIIKINFIINIFYFLTHINAQACLTL